MKKISNIIFTTPLFNEKHSAWVEHIPFAFFLVDILRPKVFLELGTHFGNSYFAFCQAIGELKLKTKAYAVDSWTGDEQAGFYGPEVFEYVTRINNQHFSHFSNLLKMSFEDAAGCFSNGTIDLLHIDGRHGYQNVKDDFETWLPKMSKNGVMIFHDTNVREPGFGVWKLMEEIRNQYLSMEFDHGHGLGIICTGSEVNSEFLDFVGKAKHDIFIEQLFSNLGHQVWLDQQNNNKQKELEQLKDLLKSKDSELAKHKTLLIEKEGEISNNERDLTSKETLINILKSDIIALNKSLVDEKMIKEIEISTHVTEKDMLKKLLIEKNLLIATLNEEKFNRVSEIETYESELNILNLQISEKEELIAENDKQKTVLSDEVFELKKSLKEINTITNQLYSSNSWRITKPLRILKLGTFVRKLKYDRILIKIKLNRLFDRAYYLDNNPDVKEYNGGPLKHYLDHGGFEGRNPGPDFNSRFYLKHYPDVALSGINPLVHYVLRGKKENRIIRPMSIEPTVNPLLQLIFSYKSVKIFISGLNKVVLFNRDMRLVKKSGLFDANYYLRTNTDVKSAGVNPFKHFFFHGWKEGRNPGKEFNTHFYLESNEDVRLSGINPLLHYVKYGRLEGRLTKPFIFDEEILISKADISKVDLDDEITEISLAVVFHLFHLELLDEFIDYFNNIPLKYDLYISTTNENKEIIQRHLASKLPLVKVMVSIFDNKGRDIAPFNTFLKSQLAPYDLVCKVHTKKSGHDIHLNNWRKYLLDNLLGSSAIIKRIILEFNQNKQLGLIWPVAHPYLVHLGLENIWGSQAGFHLNYNIAKSHFPELMIGDVNDRIDFPNGSMFWFRPEALDLLVKKDIGITNFEEENQQIDGTLAHAMERLMGIIAHRAGFETKTVFFSERILNAGQKKPSLAFATKNILFVAHDLSRAGAEILLLNLLQWLKNYTSFNLNVIALGPGNDGGKLLPDYKKVARVFMWNEFCSRYSPQEAIQTIQVETGVVDLIYGNTIISANLFPLLEVFKAPYITHIHEMEKSIQNYTTKEVRDKMKKYTSIYIPCSNPVRENLMINHHIAASQLKLVDAFIHTEKTLLIDHDLQRLIFNLPKNKTIVWGCGTIYWRKGTDIFIKTAKQLRDQGVTDFVFCWIGANYWDMESEEWGAWKKWEDYLFQNKLTENVVMIGEKERPKDYFTAGDIFYLPSREDPFPLVCLEAAECGLPIVCFEEAGGMPEFVEEDAGIVVPYLDIDSAAKALGSLIVNESIRQAKGRIARIKLLKRHSDDIAVPQILNICHTVMHSQPLVSVIVPVYNHAPFLKERIDSILNQSFKDYEVIILDDASTDNSYEIALGYDWHPAVRVIRNNVNTGSPFKQWHKGYSLAKGKLIWFAEGDDFCELNFLEKLLPQFNDPEVALAYSDSHIVNETDSITGNYEQYYGKLDTTHWKESYQVNGIQEINFGLGVKNSIPNASAVIIRKNNVSESNFIEIESFDFSGDWLFYAQILKEKKVAFCSEKLNYHRKHTQTITSKFNSNKTAIQKLIKEAEQVHNYVVNNYCLLPGFAEKWKSYVAEQIQAFFPQLKEKDFNQYYNYSFVSEKLKDNLLNSKINNRRLVFLTTNDGSHNGGSEQLWIQTAIECRRRNHELLVVIKKWNPEPYFITEFRMLGIQTIFKEDIDFSHIIRFKPDLMIVSTGDQDEGIVWYEQCQKANLSYVIINQLTKEPKYWPINPKITDQVRTGYLKASQVFFTCHNNHRVMEKRLDCLLPNASFFFQPLFTDREMVIPFPSMDKGLNLALPARLLTIHKGQHLALEVLKSPKWKERQIRLNFYGEGPDQNRLKELAKTYKLNNVYFHEPRWTLPKPDLVDIWKENHAILMPSFMEGMPLVLLNAMISGRVPIVTDIGGHSELIDNNINGFIAADPTVFSLDEAMERAYLNAPLWPEIGMRARKKVLSNIPADPIDHFINQLLPYAFNKK